MGIGTGALEFFVESYGSLRGTDHVMIELGNQRVRKTQNVENILKEHCVSYQAIGKHLFTFLDWQHISLDQNGQDGAQPIDLNIPVGDDSAQCDVLTNFGTTEHVTNQLRVWANIHKLMKPGALCINVVPMKDSWKGHSPFHYTQEFFDELIKLNEYKLVAKKILGEQPMAQVCCAFRKMNDKDFNEDDFDEAMKELK